MLLMTFLCISFAFLALVAVILHFATNDEDQSLAIPDNAVQLVQSSGFSFGRMFENLNLEGLPVCQSSPLLNKSELKLLAQVEAWSKAFAPELRIAAQPSYGEFLKAKNQKHFWQINAKRADLALYDPSGRVRAVLEFDGGGHRGSTTQSAKRAAKSDRIKDHACKSAGIHMVRLQPGYTNVELKRTLNGIFLSANVFADQATTGDTE